MNILLWTAFCLAVFPGSVREVVNGEKPENKALTLELIEETRFGADRDDDVYLWGHAGTKIVPDHSGNIYIVDPKENRVLKFDKDGNFVKLAAKPGQGPGELQGVLTMSILADGSIILLDGPPFGGLRKFIFFDKDMRYQDEKLPLESGIFPQAARFSPNGALFHANFVNLDFNTQKMMVKTGLVSKEYKVVKLFTQAERPIPNFGSQDGAYWAKFIAGNLKLLYREWGVADFAPDSHVYGGITGKYEITKYDPDLNEVMIITRKYKPIRMSEAHINGIVDFMMESLITFPQFQRILTKPVLQRAVALSEPPQIKTPMFGLIAMEDKGLLVIHDLDLATRENLADIYDVDGRFIGQVRVKDYAFMGHDLGQFQTRMVFRNGFAYTIITDENGDNYAIRYRYKLVAAEGKES